MLCFGHSFCFLLNCFIFFYQIILFVLLFAVVKGTIKILYNLKKKNYEQRKFKKIRYVCFVSNGRCRSIRSSMGQMVERKSLQGLFRQRRTN